MSAATAPSPVSPADAWQLLASGNARFVAGTPRYPHHSIWRRRDLAGGQSPFATVLTCSDSRVSPELAFDRGLGDLFVVRNAGHVLDDATMGTLEYGVLHAGSSILAVMGHEACGCIAASIAAEASGDVPPGYIGSLVREVIPAVHATKELGQTCAGEIMEEHVRRTVRGLLDKSSDLARAVEKGELAVVGLTYRLADGAVTLLDWVGNLGRPHQSSPETVHEAERAILAQQSAATSVVQAARQDDARHDEVEAEVEVVEDDHSSSPSVTG